MKQILSCVIEKITERVIKREDLGKQHDSRRMKSKHYFGYVEFSMFKILRKMLKRPLEIWNYNTGGRIELRI